MLSIRRALVWVLALGVAFVPAVRAEAQPGDRTGATEITTSVVGSVVRGLPYAADFVALYWRGRPDARVTVAFSRDGRAFDRARPAGRDEVGEARGNGVTYGALHAGRGVRWIRIASDRRIDRLSVLAIADSRPVLPLFRRGAQRPPIVTRDQWGADESLRFRTDGSEKWPPTFAPVQKLIVHHTATGNGDAHPEATVRAIYRYHAVTQGWGDIGYNFLIDEAGRIYKGRHSHWHNTAHDSVAGVDEKGHGVIAAHAKHFNRGSVGVALLGTLTGQDATPAAKQALEDLLVWKADRHGIDPNGASSYTTSDGRRTNPPNIAGHRDTKVTECPGATFYRQMPALRARVASRLGTSMAPA